MTALPFEILAAPWTAKLLVAGGVGLDVVAQARQAAQRLVAARDGTLAHLVVRLALLRPEERLHARGLDVWPLALHTTLLLEVTDG